MNRLLLSALHPAFPLLAFYAVLSGVAYSQAAQDHQVKSPGEAAENNIDNAIREVKGGNFAYVEQVVIEAGPTRAVPILKDLFLQSQDVPTKGFIASALVRLGDKDDTYWEFLVDQSRIAIDSDAPSPFVFDAQGTAIKGQVTSEFTAWVKSHGSPSDPMANDPLYGLPIKVGWLMRTGDPRAIPLLRRGLLTRNYQVQAVAAMGLATLKDRDSIPLIVEACKHAPADAASAIAMALLEFHDPEAQSAAEPFLPGELVEKLREEKH